MRTGATACDLLPIRIYEKQSKLTICLAKNALYLRFLCLHLTK